MQLEDLMPHPFRGWKYDYGELKGHLSGREVVFESPEGSRLLLSEEELAIDDEGGEWSASWYRPANDTLLFRTEFYEDPNDALVSVFTHLFKHYPDDYWSIRGGHQHRLPLPRRTGLGEFTPQESGIEVNVWRRNLGGKRYLKLVQNRLTSEVSLYGPSLELSEVLSLVGFQMEEVPSGTPVVTIYGADLSDVEQRFGSWLWSLQKAGEEARRISHEITSTSHANLIPWHERLDDGVVE